MPRSHFASLIVLVALSLVMVEHVYGQCEGWQPGPLIDNAPNGTNGVVRAMVAWDPDGLGPLPEGLMIGGDFTTVEGVPANDIAFRSSDTGDWESLLTGTTGEVRSLCVHNGQLYAAGRFDFAGGQPCANIARWTGTTWAPLGSGITMPPFGDGGVYALASYNGQLYAAGSFVAAGGISTNNIARWNGAVWAAMTGGTGGAANPIFALTVHANELIIGGNFTIINGVPANNVARWNGSNFFALEGGTNGTVFALCSLNGDLYVGGNFNSANGVIVTFAARRSGASWFALPQLLFPVSVLALYNNQVHCTTSTGSLSQLYRLNGTTSWTNLTSFQIVHALASVNGDLVAGGLFVNAGNRVANNIARTFGTQWHPYGGATADNVNAFENFGDRLLVAGRFYQKDSVDRPVETILSWNGKAFVDAGMVTPSLIGALEIHDLCSFPIADVNGPHELIAGRSFSSYVSRAIVNPQDDPAASVWSSMGTTAGQFALTGPVRVVERWNNETYIGGDFAFKAAGWSGIARWNVSTSRWVALANFNSGAALALKGYGGQLYAGGGFWLQRWNGAAWSSTNSAFNGTVRALEIHNGLLVVGGSFTGPVNSPNIATYNGSIAAGISGVGNGGANGAVHVLKSINGLLYAGGDFTMIDNTPANRIAYWDGAAWNALGNGVNGTVRSIEWYDGKLHVGGNFTIADGTLAAPGWAIWEVACACPADIAPVGGDGAVGVPDLLAVINTWGPCANPNDCPADIAPLPKGDGAVGVPDLLSIINAWGPCE